MRSGCGRKGGARRKNWGRPDFGQCGGRAYIGSLERFVRSGSGIDDLDPFFRKKGLMGHLVRTVEGEQGNELGAYREMMSLDSGNVVLPPAWAPRTPMRGWPAVR